MGADILSLSHIEDRISNLAERRRAPLMTLLTELLDLVRRLGTNNLVVQTNLEVLLAKLRSDLHLKVLLGLKQPRHVFLDILLDSLLTFSVIFRVDI